MQPITVESHPPLAPQKPTAAPAPIPPHPKSARGKNAKSNTELRQVPPCAIYEQQRHPTQNFPKIPVIRAHLDAMDTNEKIPMVELPTASVVKNKALRMNHACSLCSLYGHYSHHFQDLPECRMALDDLRHHSLESEITLIEEIHPPTPPSSDTMSIYMMSSSLDQLIPISNDGPSDLSLHCFNNNE